MHTAVYLVDAPCTGAYRLHHDVIDPGRGQLYDGFTRHPNGDRDVEDS